MTKKNKILESDIEKYLLNQCKEKDFLCYKFTSPANKGVPDRIVIGNNKTIFIELKAPGKTPRKLQKYIIKEMRKRGAIVYVIDSFEEIDNLIEYMSK